MEAGEKHANVCSSLSLALASTVANAEKIKQSAQKNTKLHVSDVSYT